MTDELREEYLWDRSGPPDADVQRLERLLAPYKHAPGELELPAVPADPETLGVELEAAVA